MVLKYFVGMGSGVNLSLSVNDENGKVESISATGDRSAAKSLHRRLISLQGNDISKFSDLMRTAGWSYSEASVPEAPQEAVVEEIQVVEEVPVEEPPQEDSIAEETYVSDDSEDPEEVIEEGESTTKSKRNRKKWGS